MSTPGNVNARIKLFVWVMANKDIVDLRERVVDLNRQSDRFPLDGSTPRRSWTAKLEMVMQKADHNADAYEHVLRLSARSERRMDVTEESSYAVRIYTRGSNGSEQYVIVVFEGQVAINEDTLYFDKIVDEEKVVHQITHFGYPDLCVEIKITEVLKKKSQSPSTPAKNTRNSAAAKRRNSDGIIHL